ncbi:uncharacterized protein VK521_014232 [Ammospiza maritima maritima]
MSPRPAGWRALPRDPRGCDPRASPASALDVTRGTPRGPGDTALGGSPSPPSPQERPSPSSWRRCRARRRRMTVMTRMTMMMMMIPRKPPGPPIPLSGAPCSTGARTAAALGRSRSRLCDPRPPQEDV